jgi:hypothetical protein
MNPSPPPISSASVPRAIPPKPPAALPTVKEKIEYQNIGLSATDCVLIILNNYDVASLSRTGTETYGTTLKDEVLALKKIFTTDIPRSEVDEEANFVWDLTTFALRFYHAEWDKIKKEFVSISSKQVVKIKYYETLTAKPLVSMYSDWYTFSDLICNIIREEEGDTRLLQVLYDHLRSTVEKHHNYKLSVQIIENINKGIWTSKETELTMAIYKLLVENMISRHLPANPDDIPIGVKRGKHDDPGLFHYTAEDGDELDTEKDPVSILRVKLSPYHFSEILATNDKIMFDLISCLMTVLDYLPTSILPYLAAAIFELGKKYPDNMDLSLFLSSIVK